MTYYLQIMTSQVSVKHLAVYWFLGQNKIAVHFVVGISQNSQSCKNLDHSFQPIGFKASAVSCNIYFNRNSTELEYL